MSNMNKWAARHTCRSQPGGKHIYPLSHLSSPNFISLMSKPYWEAHRSGKLTFLNNARNSYVYNRERMWDC